MRKQIFFILIIVIQSIVLNFCIGQIQMIYKIRYSDEVILKVGFPFDYYFFSYKGLHGIDIQNFILDVLVGSVLILTLKKVANVINSRI